METVRITIRMPFSLKGTSLSRVKARFSSIVNCTGRPDSKWKPFFLATSSYTRMSFATRAARRRFSYSTDGRWFSTKDRTSLCNSSSVRWTNPVNFRQRSIQVFHFLLASYLEGFQWWHCHSGVCLELRLNIGFRCEPRRLYFDPTKPSRMLKSSIILIDWSNNDDTDFWEIISRTKKNCRFAILAGRSRNNNRTLESPGRPRASYSGIPIYNSSSLVYTHG